MENCCCSEKQIVIRLKRGNSFNYTFRFTKHGEPLVLDDNQKLLFAVKHLRNEEPIIHKDVSDEGTGTAGEFVAYLKPSETEELTAGEYYFGFGLQTGDDIKFQTLTDGVIVISDTAPEREAANA